jgi:hypothetical protein
MAVGFPVLSSGGSGLTQGAQIGDASLRSLERRKKKSPAGS